jgi:hypothetical protein
LNQSPAFLKTGAMHTGADSAPAHKRQPIAVSLKIPRQKRVIKSLILAVSQAPGFGEANHELATLYDSINRPDLRVQQERASKGWA